MKHYKFLSTSTFGILALLLLSVEIASAFDIRKHSDPLGVFSSKNATAGGAKDCFVNPDLQSLVFGLSLMKSDSVKVTTVANIFREAITQNYSVSDFLMNDAGEKTPKLAKEFDAGAKKFAVHLREYIGSETLKNKVIKDRLAKECKNCSEEITKYLAKEWYEGLNQKKITNFSRKDGDFMMSLALASDTNHIDYLLTTNKAYAFYVKFLVALRIASQNGVKFFDMGSDRPAIDFLNSIINKDKVVIIGQVGDKVKCQSMKLDAQKQYFVAEPETQNILGYIFCPEKGSTSVLSAVAKALSGNENYLQPRNDGKISSGDRNLFSKGVQMIIDDIQTRGYVDILINSMIIKASGGNKSQFTITLNDSSEDYKALSGILKTFINQAIVDLNKGQLANILSKKQNFTLVEAAPKVS